MRPRLVLVLLGLAACGRVYADPIQINTSSTSTIDGGVLTAPSTPPFECDAEPDDNSPCLDPGAICEIGSSSDLACNSVYKCIVDQTYGPYWSETKPPTCSDSQCPAAITDGAPCTISEPDGGATPDEAEQVCPANDGICACTTGSDGAHAHPRKWVCVKPVDGCPATRPLQGEPCLGDRTCDYGSCAFKRGTSMICDQGVWQVQDSTCP